MARAIVAATRKWLRCRPGHAAFDITVDADPRGIDPLASL
jgi:hypothetical protein